MPRANRPNFVSVSKSNWRLSNCARDAIWLQRKSIEADIEYVPRPRPWTPPCWTHWLRLKTPIMAPFFAARDTLTSEARGQRWTARLACGAAIARHRSGRSDIRSGCSSACWDEVAGVRTKWHKWAAKSDHRLGRSDAI